MIYQTRTQAQNAYDAAYAERTAAEARVAASKRYWGRADDLRLIALMTDIRWAAARAIADFDATPPKPEYDADGEQLQPLFPDAPFAGDEATARAETLARLDEAFRARVAERAYYMWLNHEWRHATAEERWLHAEETQRRIDGFDDREWLSPTERRRRDRAIGLQ